MLHPLLAATLITLDRKGVKGLLSEAATIGRITIHFDSTCWALGIAADDPSMAFLT